MKDDYEAYFDVWCFIWLIILSSLIFDEFIEVVIIYSKDILSYDGPFQQDLF